MMTPELIRACLEKQPSARLQSARDLADGLKAIAGGRETQKILPPEARPRWLPAAWLGAGAAVVLVVGLAVWLYLANRRGGAIDSLAVLPRANASRDAEAEYLSDGITESLINSLSQLPALRVMARSTVFNYKGKTVDPQEVGNKLKVRAVLTGRLTQRGDTLFIGTELVKVADGSQLWGDQYQRKLADVLALQVEIAKQISEKLRLALTGEEKKRLTKRYTENPEAYQLYLKGRYIMNSYTGDGWKKGIEHFNQAIKADPTYALAYAGLAEAYYGLSSTTFPPGEMIPKVKAAATRAWELDDTLAEAHAALGLAKAQYDWHWSEAEKEFRRAVELNPGYAQTHFWFGQYLIEVGRSGESLAEFRRAQQLDPLSPIHAVFTTYPLLYQRQPDQVITQLLKIIETDSSFYPAHAHLGIAYSQKGQLTEAVAALEKARQLEAIPWVLGWLGHAYAVAGRRDEALKLLDELKERSERQYVMPYSIALVYAGLGDRDRAFEWLEKGYAERDEQLCMLKVDHGFDGLRADPRFADLLRRMNLAP